ncbi:hypothetical protein KFL_014050020 [Klebsormidium nitens]|uniref:Uncharacterized protein n=1 Tax=Klebsormidium nitens TaxID=105231 RepID=A0A1Y1IRG1_KLENI|nr:hypothetical protein KFL_014050020 [Klebsormidium nitens]|eukprot:GAQ93273.1 hypothetical protein KFL_014050020 [Klebsormidium nitens]
MPFWSCFSRGMAKQTEEMESSESPRQRSSMRHSKRAATSGNDTVLQLRGLPENVAGSKSGDPATACDSKVIISSPLPSWLSLRLQAYEYVVQSGVDTWAEGRGGRLTDYAGAQTQDTSQVTSREGPFAASLKEKKHFYEQWLDQFRATPQQLSEEATFCRSWGSSIDLESQSNHPVSDPKDSSTDLTRGKGWVPVTREEEPPNTAGSDETYSADSEEEIFSPSWVEEVLSGREERRWVGRLRY